MSVREYKREEPKRFRLVVDDGIAVPLTIASWGTWEEAAVAWPEGGRLQSPYRVIDDGTGRIWFPGTKYEWEEART